MSVETLERRVAALENEVAQLKQERRNGASAQKPWWEERQGAFKDDPLYEEAMRLGREWREAQRPKDDEDAPQ